MPVDRRHQLCPGWVQLDGTTFVLFVVSRITIPTLFVTFEDTMRYNKFPLTIDSERAWPTSITATAPAAPLAVLLMATGVTYLPSSSPGGPGIDPNNLSGASMY